MLATDHYPLIAALVNKTAPRTEAMVQADVRRLLTEAPLGLEDHQVVTLEAPASGGRRIDIEVGYTVIEVKKNLGAGHTLKDAEDQLAGYVRDRTTTMGQRYVGVLTDGADWRAYDLHDDALREVTRITVDAQRPDGDALLVWLEGVLATTQAVKATPAEVEARLGATSSSYALDRASLAALYADHGRDASVALKRDLWARLLTTALGTQFEDTDELFIEHTLLVNTAKVVAHGLLGMDPTSLPPASLLSGVLFDRANVHGVVESDFFDWVLEVPGGEAYVRTLARRLGRFDWGAVDHDVLKVLYQSVIGAETRKRLGEYYTPDWLAERVVAETVDDPLHQLLLAAACGSGTFLFHAVRRYLDAADAAGTPPADALGGLGDRVLGLDLHPVAVALARVTYLLAVGTERLRGERRTITVPVYLGDSVQWQQRLDLSTADHVRIRIDDNAQLFDSELVFPDRLLDDAARFDQLVTGLSDAAAKPRQPGSVPSLSALLRRLAVSDADRKTVEETFAVMCRLHDEGRDHIWGYYVRNLARPLWLARPENRIDVLVGNPPWLSYRQMPGEMQRAFKAMSVSRGLWHGATVATQQDLSGLFVARSVQQYLRTGGRFGFVLPNGALDRDYYRGFRSGRWPDPSQPTYAAFGESWDLRRLRPHFFPRGACVVFGRRAAENASAPLPRVVQRWTGELPRGDSQWSAVEAVVSRAPAVLPIGDAEAEKSPYAERFASGANLFPRFLFWVTELPAGALGRPVGQRPVKSERSHNENQPWKGMEDLEGVVEESVIRQVVLGENVLPYRLLAAFDYVLPLEGDRLLDDERIGMYPRFADWWRRAETVWAVGRRTKSLSLRGQADYYGKLTGQLPVAPRRVLYAASGMHVAAVYVEGSAAIAEHSIYWASVGSAAEGRYLCALLNSPVTTALVRPLMAYGKDERHIAKAVWRLPIAAFDPSDERHTRLVDLAVSAESEVANLDLRRWTSFIPQRRAIRRHLSESTVGREINELVMALLDA